MRNFNVRPELQIAKKNYDLAVAYLESSFIAFSQADQESWIDEFTLNQTSKSIYKEPASVLDKGLYVFKNYFLKTFTYDNVNEYTSATLGAGTGNSYSARASRIWVTA